MNIPNFFIVGAPKCGTTSMYRYLGQHPEIFMPVIKEPHFFGSDLLSSKYIRDEVAYRALFASRRNEPLAGEASVYYLYSRTAAHEIRAFNPAARIIIMLRNPVDMVYSLHSQAVSSGNEDCLNFSEALDAEAERREGRRMPDIADFPQGLLYTDIARYPGQLKRYLSCFTREQVKILLFDDFAAATEAVYRETLRFLGVDDPDLDVDFTPANPHRRLRSVALEHFLKKRRGLRDMVKRTAPGLYSRLYSQFHRFNAVEVRRDAMDSGTRARLCNLFADDVSELGGLIGRDLTHWLSE